MSSEPDLIVLGGGPAGIQAAVSASAHGLDTLLIDQALNAGGQVYRPLPGSYTAGPSLRQDADFARGEKLRSQLKSSSAKIAFGYTVWRVGAGFEVEAFGSEGTKIWRPKALIAATGAYERCVPFPGWTRPGVIGLAAATILLKSQQMLPGRRVVVAGCGPLLAAVAAAILKAGGQVAAVVDLAGPSDWLKILPALATRPDQFARGLKWLLAIRAAGVPILHRHTIVEAVGNDDGLSSVTVAPATAGGVRVPGSATRSFDVDCLAVGHGLIPSCDVTRALRARHVYKPDFGGWVAETDDGYRTSVDNLYVCGDCAGIRGAVPAALQGELAGLTAAHDQGRLDKVAYERKASSIRIDLRRANRFGAAMAQLMAPRPEMACAVADDTVVCRCEEIKRSEIEEALDVGAVNLNQLKAWTRAGMGPCQGRVCGETIATLTAARMGGIERVGLWTSRVPIRPVPMTSIVGDYRYEDIVWGGNRAFIDDEGRPLVK